MKKIIWGTALVLGLLAAAHLVHNHVGSAGHAEHQVVHDHR